MPCDACSHDFEDHHAGSGLCDCGECAGFIALGDVPDDADGPEGDEE